jgi:uncharacterized protein YoxC
MIGVSGIIVALAILITIIFLILILTLLRKIKQNKKIRD